ncbi:MAG: GWxTD domain-containing protein [Saprospiraceae bacterium]|nr:GWxTD domain-containing protein [Saprospiraceae bacterium]
MRNWLLFFVAILSTPRLFAIDASVNTIVYATPEKTYVEVCLEIAGTTVQHVPLDSLSMSASVEVLMILRVEGTEDAFSVEKYQLNGPRVATPSSLIDVRRFTVPVGRYNLEIKLRDLNNANNVHFMNRAFEVSTGSGIYLTDIQLLRNFYPEDGQTTFHRNGFFMEPLPSRVYDRGAPLLIFYAEVYHSNKSIADPNFLVRYVVEEMLANGQTKLWGSGNQRKAPSPIDAVLVQMDISNMNSGNYRITLELRNNANELIATRQLVFQRNNPLLAIDENAITDKMVEKEFVQQLSPEELEYALRAVSPLVRMGDEPALLQSILVDKDPKAMRLFLFKYFVRLDANNPQGAYNKYMDVARAVDNKFHSGFRYGFETDRGRTFLRYGKPDDVVREDNEPSAPPYEIWIYYNFPVTNQRNVKFLFYNPSLAGDDFIVLHSTARGEINNPRWERDLYARNAGEEYQGDNYHDATKMKDNVYRNARAYFEDF